MDHAGQIICVGIGQPNDDGQLEQQKWLKAMEDAATEIEGAREQCSFGPKNLDHRHGPFPTLAAGVSFSGGQVIPGNLAHNQANRKVLQKLLCHPSFIHISNFANRAFATWFLKMYDYYHETWSTVCME